MSDDFLALLAEADGLSAPGAAELHAAFLAAPPEARSVILGTLAGRIMQARADAAEREDTRRAVERLAVVMEATGRG